MLVAHRVNPWPGMKSSRSFTRPLLLALALAVLGACQSNTPAPPAAVALPSSPAPQPPAAAPSARAILATYVAIAEASYSDALQGARQLSAAIDDLLERPGEDTLQRARAAWLAARVPYLQTEAYRFGNAFVDE